MAASGTASAKVNSPSSATRVKKDNSVEDIHSGSPLVQRRNSSFRGFVQSLQDTNEKEGAKMSVLSSPILRFAVVMVVLVYVVYHCWAVQIIDITVAIALLLLLVGVTVIFMHEFLHTRTGNSSGSLSSHGNSNGQAMPAGAASKTIMSKTTPGKEDNPNPAQIKKVN